MKGLTVLIGFLIVIEFTDSAPCSLVESLDISNGFVHQNGSVFLFGVEFTNETSYEVEQNGTVVRYGCPCIKRICTWKCCGEKQSFHNRQCADSAIAAVDPFSPPLYKGREPSSMLAHETFFFMYTRTCEDRYGVDTATAGEQLFLQEGSVTEGQTGPYYCHDTFLRQQRVSGHSLPSNMVEEGDGWHMRHTRDRVLLEGRWSALSIQYTHGTVYYAPTVSHNDAEPPDRLQYPALYGKYNGTLIEVAPGGVQWHGPGQFCLDMSTDNQSLTPRLFGAVCYPDTPTQVDDSPLLYTAYAIGMVLSVPFLLATFLVYALIPELRNLHGMCLMAYCAGLIVAYPFLAYLKLHVGQIGVGVTACLVVAFIIYFAFQTSFFWLNVMCFDIWRTFSGYRGGGTSKRRELRRFAMYAVYAWGVPVVLTAITAGMQFGDVSGHIISPGFGTKKCWFVDWLAELVYFFTPVLALVVCNVVFFSVTAHRIRSIRQETAILKGSESSRSDKLEKDKQRYGLYLKLFLVMGVNWTVELISFAVGGSNWYWILTDISNIALGIFIFFIFVWKKKVRLLVQKRFRRMVGRETSSDGRPTGWTSTSAPTEDTRISSEDTTLRMKNMR